MGRRGFDVGGRDGGVEKKELVQLIKVVKALIWCTVVDVNKQQKNKIKI